MPPQKPDHRTGPGSAILDTEGDPIEDGKMYKIRTPDGSEITQGQYEGDPLVAIGPMNSGLPCRVSCSADVWRQGDPIKIRMDGAGGSWWTACFLNGSSDLPRYLEMGEESGWDKPEQDVKGIQQDGAIWISVGGLGLQVSKPCDDEGGYLKSIECVKRDSGEEFIFECTFVPVPEPE